MSATTRTVSAVHDGHTYTCNVVDTSVTILRDGVYSGSGTLTLTRAGTRIDDCPANLPEEVFEALEQALDAE